MCTVVEVALIADVLRPSDARRFGTPPRSLCRRLFSDERAESPLSCVQRLEADIERQVRQRWNFDFRNETPLPGRYQWVPVGAAPPQAASSQTDGDRRPKEQSRTTSVTQSKITDFLHQRKRHRTLDSDVPCSKPLKARRIAEQKGPSVVTIE